MATLVRNPNTKIWRSRKGEDWMAENKRTSALLDELWDKSAELDPKGDLTGAMMRFQIADGYAFYQVVKTKPLQIMHIPYGDAWQVDDMLIRGMRLQDVRESVRKERALVEIFSKPRKRLGA